MDYIEKHVNEKITLDRIALTACFSPVHFHRVFSTLINETLHTFSRRKRIKKAARQFINEDNISISEITYHCRFGSIPHFSLTFRKYFGLTIDGEIGNMKLIISRNLKNQMEETYQ